MKEKSVIPINQEEISSYLKDIRKLTVMTPERERVLAEKMLNPTTSQKERDSIKKELLEGNLRFVITVSKQYQNQGLDFPDLVAEGNYGLMKADLFLTLYGGFVNQFFNLLTKTQELYDFP